jgi:hypothetical protein
MLMDTSVPFFLNSDIAPPLVIITKRVKHKGIHGIDNFPVYDRPLVTLMNML